MLVERANNLNETNSPAEITCRFALANAGYAFGEPVSFHWSQLTNPAGDKSAAMIAYETLLKDEQNNKSALEGLAYLYQIQGMQAQARSLQDKLSEIEKRENRSQNGT